MISQSFDIFNIYGKSPEATANILKGFLFVLESDEISADEISAAFKGWMQQKSNMPTPADILKIIQENAAERARYDRFKTYEYSPPKKETNPTVPWAFKVWAEFTESDKRGLSEHLERMEPAKRETYVKYLQNWCGMPKTESYVQQPREENEMIGRNDPCVWWLHELALNLDGGESYKQGLEMHRKLEAGEIEPKELVDWLQTYGIRPSNW